MKMNTVKRLALSGLLALSVTGGTLAPVVASHASAASRGETTTFQDDCRRVKINGFYLWHCEEN